MVHLQPARHSKLEKADILEKTVKYLQDLQRQQIAMTQASDPQIVNKFKAGFTECAKEVDRFSGIDPNVKRKLLQHLNNYINEVKTEQSTAQQSVHPQHHIQQVQIHMLPSSPPGSPEQSQQQQILQITPTNGYYLKLPNGILTYVAPQQLPQTALPTLVPIPSRTSSTASSTSNTSSTTTFERLSVRENTTSPISYAPPSPANSYEAMDYQTSPSPSVPHRTQTQSLPEQQQQIIKHLPALQKPHQWRCGPSNMSIIKEHQHMAPYNPAPLSLVMKKSQEKELVDEDERPWRPW